MENLKNEEQEETLPKISVDIKDKQDNYQYVYKTEKQASLRFIDLFYVFCFGLIFCGVYFANFEYQKLQTKINYLETTNKYLQELNNNSNLDLQNLLLRIEELKKTNKDLQEKVQNYNELNAEEKLNNFTEKLGEAESLFNSQLAVNKIFDEKINNQNEKILHLLELIEQTNKKLDKITQQLKVEN